MCVKGVCRSKPSRYVGVATSSQVCRRSVYERMLTALSVAFFLNTIYSNDLERLSAMAQSRASGSKATGGPKIPDIKSAINDIKGSVAQPFVLPRKPRSDEEAQRLYYHIRTLCYWLDAANTIVRIPFLDKLPFTFGVEAIIGSLVPVAGGWPC